MHTCATAIEEPSKQTTPLHSPFFSADIVFGSPNDPGCMGCGICRMLPVEKATIIPSAVHAEIRRHGEAGMTIFVKACDLSDHQVAKHFSATFFRVESSFVFPKWLKARYRNGFSFPERIEPGLYKLEKTGAGYLITLPFRTSN